jgi:hypothetical protein
MNAGATCPSSTQLHTNHPNRLRPRNRWDGSTQKWGRKGWGSETRRRSFGATPGSAIRFSWARLGEPTCGPCWSAIPTWPLPRPRVARRAPLPPPGRRRRTFGCCGKELACRRESGRSRCVAHGGERSKDDLARSSREPDSDRGRPRADCVAIPIVSRREPRVQGARCCSLTESMARLDDDLGRPNRAVRIHDDPDDDGLLVNSF